MSESKPMSDQIRNAAARAVLDAAGPTRGADTMSDVERARIDAVVALRYLACHQRPIGGQDRFNAEHLLDIADRLASPQGVNADPDLVRRLTERAKVAERDSRFGDQQDMERAAELLALAAAERLPAEQQQGGVSGWPTREQIAQCIDRVAWQMRPEAYGLSTEEEMLNQTVVGGARRVALGKADEILALFSPPPQAAGNGEGE